MLGIALAAGMLFAALKEAPPVAPNTLVIVACRVDDLGALDVVAPGVHDPGARNYQLHIQNGVYECKRDVLANIVDATAQAHPELRELRPNFGKVEQCGIVGVTFVPDWEREHPGWSVVALGCPSPMVDTATGAIVGWQLPGCPSYLPGTDSPMKCEYDGSEI